MSTRKRKRINRRKVTNNLLVFKLMDPIVQSLLFIYLIYSIDTDSEVPYHTVFLLLFSLQIVSLLVNFFIIEENQLKKERVFYLGVITLYIFSFFLIRKTVNPKYIDVIIGSGPVKMDLNELILMSAAMVISFWYFVICFREIRGLLKAEGSHD